MDIRFYVPDVLRVCLVLPGHYKESQQLSS